MRTRQRTAQAVYYRLYTGMEEVTDANGYATGEFSKEYADPVATHMNVSPAYGEDAAEIFGMLERYDKILQTCDMTCPIDENSVLYVDEAPVQRRDGTWSANDYVVKRVARSVNTIRYAVAKVKVTAVPGAIVSA